MIDTVLFDMGGTLEDIYNDKDSLARALQGVIDILVKHGAASPELTVSDISEKLYLGRKAYKKYSNDHFIELKPEQIWRDYFLKEIDGLDFERLTCDVCEELAHMWEVTYYVRKLRAGVPEMLEGLKSLGLRLGVISNTAALFQVFWILEEYGIRSYFDDVTLSSVTGYRKPHPHIFKVALWQMGKQADPASVAYVGDTLSRDVIGPRQSGFGETFQIKSFLTASRDVGLENEHPDHLISDIREVYTILKTELGK